MLNPAERLGGGGDNGYQAIKTHPFFAGVNWETLAQQTPPKVPPRPPPGGTPNATGYGCRDLRRPILVPRLPRGTMAQLAPLSPRSTGESLPSSPRGVIEVPLATPVNVREEQNRAQLLEEQRRTSKWADFVLPTELVVMTGTVNKKKGLFAKRRQLILTDTPRLVYVDDDKVGACERHGALPYALYSRRSS